jgi:hypothetical protein
MRLYGLSEREVEGVVIPRNLWGLDPSCKPIYLGRSDEGHPVTVFMALDEPDVVVTLYEEQT